MTLESLRRPLGWGDTSAEDRRAIREAEQKRRRRQLRPQGSGMLSSSPTDPKTGHSTDPFLLEAIAQNVARRARASARQGMRIVHQSSAWEVAK